MEFWREDVNTSDEYRTEDDRKKVVMIADVLKILLLSAPGKNRMIDASSPNLDSSTSRAIEEISAVAMPTSSAG